MKIKLQIYFMKITQYTIEKSKIQKKTKGKKRLQWLQKKIQKNISKNNSNKI